MPENGGENVQRWAGFSDYEDVASQLHKDINRAVNAYSHLNSRDVQGISLTPQTAVATRTAILTITKRLWKEIQRNKGVDPFDDIIGRWGGEDGFVRRLEHTDFYNEGVPSWLGVLIDDLVDAGWELGYLKAGMEKPADPDNDERQAKAMFQAGDS